MAIHISNSTAGYLVENWLMAEEESEKIWLNFLDLKRTWSLTLSGRLHSRRGLPTNDSARAVVRCVSGSATTSGLTI
jgi:hypothetical protein